MRLAGGWGAATVALALLDPFSLGVGRPVWAAFAIWGGVVALGLILALGGDAVMRRWPVLSPGWADLSIAAFVALGLGPTVWAAAQGVDDGTGARPPDLVEVIGTMLALCLSLAMLRLNLRPRGDHAAVAVPVAGKAGGSAQRPAPARRPPFLDRMDQHVPGDLLRVSADDHYLHVHTEQAEARIFMRFRDALVELEHLRGFRIHRSHWVAAHAVREVRAEGRRHVMELWDGTVLPVSQAYLERLRVADLYDPRGMGNRMGVSPSKIASASVAMRSDSTGRSQNSPPV